MIGGLPAVLGASGSAAAEGLGLRMSDYEFELPNELGAPGRPTVRGDVRLLVLDRKTGRIQHRRWGDLVEILGGRTVYVNNSRLLPHWIEVWREPGYQERAFLVKRLGEKRWEAVLAIDRALAASRFFTSEGKRIRLEEQIASERWILSFDQEPDLGRLGRYLVPPGWGLVREAGEERLAQALYARVPGSFAAATAGIHLTWEMLSGLDVRELTLHTAPGTFYRIKEEDPGEYRMNPERYAIPDPPGKPVIAVGTTVAKALETWARTGEREGWSELFIRPPFEWKAVGGLLTNLHRPRETLLLLTCAFGGYEAVMEAHREAVRERYRFSYYEDLMLIL